MYYFTVYQITNNLNNYIYIGVHKTRNINDNYFGSGDIIKRVVKKYGKECFTKTILFVFNDSESMYKKEAEIVNENFVKRNDTYNIKIGGIGGFDHINDNIFLVNKRLEKLKISLNIKKSPEDLAKTIEKRKKTMAERYPSNFLQSTFLGKKHTEETKLIISSKNKISLLGKNNGSFNTVWISNTFLKKSYKIKKEFLKEELKKDFIVMKRLFNNKGKYLFKKTGNKRDIKRKLNKSEKIIHNTNEKLFLIEEIKKAQNEHGLKTLTDIHKYLKSENLFTFSRQSLDRKVRKYNIVL